MKPKITTLKYLVFLICLCLIKLETKAQSDYASLSGARIYYEYVPAKNAPTVVLEAGARSHSAIWNNLVPLLVEAGYGVFRYDRPGLGSSEPVSTARTGKQISEELSALLRTLEVSQELILVGHSMGGMYLAIYNDMFPENVKGLVMIDSPNGEWEGLLRGCLTDEQNNSRDAGLENMRASQSETVRNEYADANTSFDQLANVRLNNGLTVISGGNQQWPENFDGGCLNLAWSKVQKQQLNLSTNSNQVIASSAGHNIPVLVPELIKQAIDRYR